jgi:hypothetical protein
LKPVSQHVVVNDLSNTRGGLGRGRALACSCEGCNGWRAGLGGASAGARVRAWGMEFAQMIASVGFLAHTAGNLK